MPGAGASIERALRALEQPGGLAELAAALGLDPVCRDAPELGAPGLADFEFLTRVVVLAERPLVRVLFLHVRGGSLPRALLAVSKRLRSVGGAWTHLLIAADASLRRLALACDGPDGELRHLSLEADSVRETDLETLSELVAEPGEGGVALCLRWSRALDRSRVTARFFADFRAQRAQVAAAWSGIPRGARADRDELALQLLCRLMFLYFLQKHGHLCGDPSYLAHQVERWRRAGARGTFFRRVLRPLFFGALNTRPERRTRFARALGELPYLNGGLFERGPCERRWRELDLPDPLLMVVFERLFERYRFTTRDRSLQLAEGAAAAGVDPEMLGRVFEGLMSPDQRGETGTFFTPPQVVDRLIDSALRAHVAHRLGVSAFTAGTWLDGAVPPPESAALASLLREVRVLDPACGSGAFLLGALSRLARLRARFEGGDPIDIRRDLVARALHGVDLQADAALLCALRLWLALAVPENDERVANLRPLPNLDRRIRQGDALLDPLDLTAGGAFGSFEQSAAADVRVRRAAARLAPLGSRYVLAEPGERERVLRALKVRELKLARVWLNAVRRRCVHRIAELRRRAAQRDLWGEAGVDARAATEALPRVAADLARLDRLDRAVRDTHALPFFSFAVHFAEAALSDGFDLVLTNPPWVRAHNWPASVGRLVRNRYRVCRESGWKLGAALGSGTQAAGAQVDLSLLFLERSLRLLAPRGTLAMLLPAKLFRSLYGGPARAMLLQQTRLTCLEDYSLHQHAIFAADSFAASVVATRAAAATGATAGGEASGTVHVCLHRRRGEPLRFEVEARELSLIPGDDASPWLLVPAAVRRVLRRMQNRGAAAGRRLRIRRGLVTGANDVLVLCDVEPKIGGLAWIRAEGARRAPGSQARRPRRVQRPARAPDFEALVEARAIRPLLRGTDVGQFCFRAPRHVLWVHGDGASAPTPMPRLQKYLERHQQVLSRAAVGAGAHPGRLCGVARDLLGPKVAWQDLALALTAVAVPATVATPLGHLPVIPLNSVYFIPAADDAQALRLAALLNSMPVRVFARCIAERAKDARFRFFAWTIGVLPLPPAWETSPALLTVSREAHAMGGMDAERSGALAACVAAMYGLGQDDLAALAEFDLWLSGR